MGSILPVSTIIGIFQIGRDYLSVALRIDEISASCFSLEMCISGSKVDYRCLSGRST